MSVSPSPSEATSPSPKSVLAEIWTQLENNMATTALRFKIPADFPVLEVIQKITFQVFGTVDFENFITFREILRRMALAYINYPIVSRANVFDDVFMDTRALKNCYFAYMPKESNMPRNLHFVAICNAILRSWYKDNVFKPTEDELFRRSVSFSSEVCERFLGLVASEIVNGTPIRPQIEFYTEDISSIISKRRIRIKREEGTISTTKWSFKQKIQKLIQERDYFNSL